MTYISAEPYYCMPLAPPSGGAIVLCSDGVWDHLQPAEVSAVLLRGGYITAPCRPCLHAPGLIMCPRA